MARISKNIEEAAELLTKGELVAIPTETVYGLAANIFKSESVSNIFKLKNRPLYNPLIVHTHSIDAATELVEGFPGKAQLLVEHFWPGPLTLVLKKKSIIPDQITAGKDTVAIRIPNHPTTLALLKKLDFPLAAPSANPFGSISPTKAEHVASYFNDDLPIVLDGGPCTSGIESTIIGFPQGEPIVYRLGSISLEDIEKVVGGVQLQNKDDKAPAAPGMMSRHYAPNTKTVLVKNVTGYVNENPDKKLAVLSFDTKIGAENVITCKVLSAEGNLDEAMAKLYATLHDLDKLAIDEIVAEHFPDTGVGRAINDRLTRATKGKPDDTL